METLGGKTVTTIAVLTESFHLLRPPRPRAGLMDFVLDGHLRVVALDNLDLGRCFELMVQYADAPMDFADASLVAVAERSGIDRVFTLDRRHFAVYRMKRGHRHVPFTIVGPRAEPPMVREGGDRPDTCLPEPFPTPSAGERAANAAYNRDLAEAALRDVREALDRLDRTLVG